MVGMTTTSSSALSDYRSRSVVIDVAGMANQTISRVSNYQVKVPFSQMSATIRNIACQGGKVVNVTVVGSPPMAASASADASVSRRQSAKPTGPDKQASHKKTSSHKKKMASRSSSRKGRRAKKTS